jgi:hypothetical protein
MDSASPIAQRIAGQSSLATGIFFTFAMWTNKAEKVAPIRTRNRSGHARGYRDIHRRSSHGEGRPA